MNKTMTGAMLIFSVLLLLMSICEAKHWPDFSCHPFNATTLRGNKVNYHKMGWESCRGSFEKYKQVCDKMCVLINRNIVRRTYHNGPFNFYTDAFQTVMLQELGYKDKTGSAPRDIVEKIGTELEACKVKYREYESMSNFKNLPCEPYNDLFKCVHVAVGCGGELP